MKIQTERLNLNILRQSDLSDLFQTMDHEHTARTISFMYWPMTEEQAQSWYDLSCKGFQKKTDYCFIARNESSDAVGCISLHVDDGNKKRGEIGYWICEEHQRQGYASECARAAVSFAFDDLSLETLWATYIPDNVPSGKVLEKLGFTFVKHIVKDVVSADKDANRVLVELKKGDNKNGA